MHASRSTQGRVRKLLRHTQPTQVPRTHEGGTAQACSSADTRQLVVPNSLLILVVATKAARGCPPSAGGKHALGVLTLEPSVTRTHTTSAAQAHHEKWKHAYNAPHTHVHTSTGHNSLCRPAYKMTAIARHTHARRRATQILPRSCCSSASAADCRPDST